MNNYYEEIEHIIIKNEINRKARMVEDNTDTLNNYWNIGRLIVEAQGGESRAKYGNELIKEWSKKLSIKYGKGYDLSNLKRFRMFYLVFPKGGAVRHQLNWTQIRIILPIKNENKRNYYINLCIEHNLSSRELIKEIKSNSYERLVDKKDKIDIVIPKNNINVLTNLKNPIIISLNKNESINNEKELELKILSELQAFFRQLGNGYSLIGNEFKIVYNNTNYYIDILLFNYETNNFVVIELKLRELRREDKSQVKFYMELVDKNIKKPFHNKTIGIIISREQDKFIATFVGEEDIIPITYKLIEKESEYICE